jgi:hypothetical protein
VINSAWLKLRYPPYWHYNTLQALLILSRLGPLTDPRTQEALDRLEAKRSPGGCWQAEVFYWRRPAGKLGTGVEVVDWGRSGPNTMITLNALRVLLAARRTNTQGGLNANAHTTGRQNRRGPQTESD